MGANRKLAPCWSDGSEEINSSLKRLSWPHDTSAPNRPATNSPIERAVQRTKGDTTVCLIQAGLGDMAVT